MPPQSRVKKEYYLMEQFKRQPLRSEASKECIGGSLEHVKVRQFDLLQLSIEQMQKDMRNNDNLAFSAKQVFKKTGGKYRIKAN